MPHSFEVIEPSGLQKPRLLDAQGNLNRELLHHVNTVAGLAALCGCSKHRIYRAIKAKQLIAHQGFFNRKNQWHIEPANAERWLQNRMQGDLL
jgi:hypothetical protein